MAPVAEHRVRIVAWTAFVTFPLAGLSILLAAPHADVRWENHPSHFWLVLGTSIATAILAYATGEVAARRGDGRLFIVSLGFLAAAGGAAAVARLVGDDREQPGPKGRPRPEARQGAPGLHEALLRRLLGVGGRAARQAGDPKGDVLVCAHEGSIGDGVALLGPRDQRGFVVGWPAHHR